MKKRLDAGAATAPPSTITANPGVSSIDRATWAEQAKHLASNHAQATFYYWSPRVALVVMLVAVVAIWADVKLLDLVFVVFGAMLIGLTIIALLASQVYSEELNAGTRAIWRATWEAEEADQRDYTNDGFIGDPFSQVKVKREGQVVDEVVIPMPSNSIRGMPIMNGWGITQHDLVAFLFEAERGRGLQERAWVGQSAEQFVLPSGRAVTQTLFRSLLAALAEHEMASKPDGRWRLDVAAIDVANQLKST